MSEQREIPVELREAIKDVGALLIGSLIALR